MYNQTLRCHYLGYIIGLMKQNKLLCVGQYFKYVLLLCNEMNQPLLNYHLLVIIKCGHSSLNILKDTIIGGRDTLSLEGISLAIRDAISQLIEDG